LIEVERSEYTAKEIGAAGPKSITCREQDEADRMGRNAELIRQWTLLQRIATVRAQTIPKLATELSVSTRTIRRDLEALQLAGFPVYDETVHGSKFWRVDTRGMGALARTGLT
jgi:biotin operon repressor